MNEKQLLKVGFKKDYIFGSDEEYYFSYKFPDEEKNVNGLELISNTNLESEGKYTVEFFDTWKYQFTKITQIKRFIKLLKEIDTGKS